MNPKKIFILLPDGVGLRNFAFTSFVKTGTRMGWEVTFLNNTPFDLNSLGLKEIKLEGKPRAKTDLLKRAKIEAELDHFSEKFEDPVYQTYKFPPSEKGVKKKIKNKIVSALVRTHRGEKGLANLRTQLKASERKGDFYKKCKKILKKERPDFVFCTNQRPVTAIAPLTAAQDLNIPTGTFIFSWDNLPKATMVVEPDHYFVWSNHMEKELLSYYPFISREQVHITGSPQFEPHFDKSLRKDREEFFLENGLDITKEYICFSGDDVTTCPDDQHYLKDVAEAIAELNREGYNLGVLFRRCPVDLSDRYNEVIEKFNDIIVPVAPKWEKHSGNWNSVLPKKEDLELQVNTILHTKAVINLASSMVFDYAVFNKPCFYLNYEVGQKADKTWTPGKVYNFVHFRSMPSNEAVIWLTSKEIIRKEIISVLKGSVKSVIFATSWFNTINKPPSDEANTRIWCAMEGILQIQNSFYK